MEKLDLKPEQLIDEAYVDLLARRDVDYPAINHLPAAAI
jgi:hypothetical protein